MLREVERMTMTDSVSASLCSTDRNIFRKSAPATPENRVEMPFNLRMEHRSLVGELRRVKVEAG
jgi:hypothetical protein